jgi:hypothetical protein
MLSRMIVPPCSSHSPLLDVVTNDLTAAGKCFVANPVLSSLLGDLPVDQLAHLGW